MGTIFVALVILMSSFIAPFTDAQVQRFQSQSPGPAYPYHSILGQLNKSPIPVYLPSWLPQVSLPAGKSRLYPVVSFFNQRSAYQHLVGYDVSLYDDPVDRSHASLIFHMDGTSRPDILFPGLGAPLQITNETRPYRVGNGWAYVDPNRATTEGPTISWWEGRYLYSFGRSLRDQQLLRVARSVIRIR
jgi:hypothetical protein